MSNQSGSMRNSLAGVGRGRFGMPEPSRVGGSVSDSTSLKEREAIKKPNPDAQKLVLDSLKSTSAKFDSNSSETDADILHPPPLGMRPILGAGRSSPKQLPKTQMTTFSQLSSKSAEFIPASESPERSSAEEKESNPLRQSPKDHALSSSGSLTSPPETEQPQATPDSVEGWVRWVFAEASHEPARLDDLAPLLCSSYQVLVTNEEQLRAGVKLLVDQALSHPSMPYLVSKLITFLYENLQLEFSPDQNFRKYLYHCLHEYFKERNVYSAEKLTNFSLFMAECFRMKTEGSAVYPKPLGRACIDLINNLIDGGHVTSACHVLKLVGSALTELGQASPDDRSDFDLTHIFQKLYDHSRTTQDEYVISLIQSVMNGGEMWPESAEQSSSTSDFVPLQSVSSDDPNVSGDSLNIPDDDNQHEIRMDAGGDNAHTVVVEDEGDEIAAAYEQFLKEQEEAMMMAEFGMS